MINITIYKKEETVTGVSIEGHANHAQKGYDIYCGAMTTLFYSLKYALHEIAELEIEVVEHNGKGKVFIGLNDYGNYEGQLFFEQFIGMSQQLQQSYPEYYLVNVVQEYNGYH